MAENETMDTVIDERAKYQQFNMRWSQSNSNQSLPVAHLSLILALTCIALQCVKSAPTSSGVGGTRHHHRRHMQHRGRPSLDEHFDPAMASSRVAFTQHKPTSPPYADISAGDFDPEDEAVLRGMAQGDAAGRRSRREVRDPQVRPVCDSESKWVLKTRAEDIHGNMYTVMQEIYVNGVTIFQYFYETTCSSTSSSSAAATPRACTGIDPLRFTSMCMETSTYVYAEVMAADGTTGWTLIKNPASCNCGVMARGPRENIDFS